MPRRRFAFCCNSTATVASLAPFCVTLLSHIGLFAVCCHLGFVCVRFEIHKDSRRCYFKCACEQCGNGMLAVAAHAVLHSLACCVY